MPPTPQECSPGLWGPEAHFRQPPGLSGSENQGVATGKNAQKSEKDKEEDEEVAVAADKAVPTKETKALPKALLERLKKKGIVPAVVVPKEEDKEEKNDEEENVPPPPLPKGWREGKSVGEGMEEHPHLVVHLQLYRSAAAWPSGELSLPICQSYLRFPCDCALCRASLCLICLVARRKSSFGASAKSYEKLIFSVKLIEKRN